LSSFQLGSIALFVAKARKKEGAPLNISHSSKEVEPLLLSMMMLSFMRVPYYF
jgi:hypothetical protein